MNFNFPKHTAFTFIFLLSFSIVYAQDKGLEIPTTPKGKKELIFKRSNYTLSFNKEANLPNWVAWRLDKNKLVESVSRKGYTFTPDPTLNTKDAVITQDYTRSGYDRGHMCPAGDSRWSANAMKESFYMTNICPQNPNLNGGDWHELEQACRKWAAQGPIYIVCGPVLYNGTPQYIGNVHRIRVPEAFFKVILAGLEDGNPRAIGFIYKNSEGNRTLDKYVNSIDQVERITGYDFFPLLPDSIESKVEKEYNLYEWR